MNVLIQQINVNWTKKSRGSPQSVRRNAVPEYLSVNSFSEDPGVQLQQIYFYESNDFKLPDISQSRFINENQQRQMGFHFIENNEKLLISVWGAGGNIRELTELEPNSWMRSVSNGRTVSFDNAIVYFKVVYNIFYGMEHKANELFRSKSPAMIDNQERIIR